MLRFAAFSLAVFLGNAWCADEAAGRGLYLEGVRPSGEPLSALVGFGQTALSGAAVACGNCHGADGKGRAESSVRPPEITWQELTKPYGHAHASGRKHAAFEERSFARAVNEGLDPAGNRLDWAMPRYALSRADVDALVAYLEGLHAARDPGVGERTLRIGAVLPRDAARAEAGHAASAALAAYFETVNRAGGVHQRHLELVVAGDYREARERFTVEPVFALLGAAATGDEAEFGALVGDTTVPLVAAFDASAVGGRRSSERVFQVLPGFAEEAAVLVEFATRRSQAGALRGSIVASGAAPFDEAARKAGIRCAALKCGDLERVGWYAARFDAAATVKRLKAERRNELFFFGSDDEMLALLVEAGKARDPSWQPSLYAPSARARMAMLGRERFGGALFLAFPAFPGTRAWQELRREFGLPAHHEAAQTGALAAAAVLVEGLRRAGRDLGAERFVRALEGLSNFDPGGFAAPVSYGPDRRVGALGGYVVALERGGAIVPASAWIALDR